MLRLITILSILFFCVYPVWASSVVAELTEPNIGPAGLYDLVTEKVIQISSSGRIFLISNNNGVLLKGDFITLVRDDELITRALVAKVAETGIVGIKIVKIYDAPRFSTLKSGAVVQIIRGDDSYFKKSKDEVTEKIKEEDDLFDDKVLLEGDVSLEENKNRVLKQDNLVSAVYASVAGVNNDHSPQSYPQFMGQWAYQFADNVFAEVGYGQSIVSDFPTPGLDTLMRNFVFRVKYAFNIPFSSLLLPYVGYQMITASSPGAGIKESGEAITAAQLQNELDLVSELEARKFVFGVTLLRRLVPGWFVKADVGFDFLAAGLSLEF